MAAETARYNIWSERLKSFRGALASYFDKAWEARIASAIEKDYGLTLQAPTSEGVFPPGADDLIVIDKLSLRQNAPARLPPKMRYDSGSGVLNIEPDLPNWVLIIDSEKGVVLSSYEEQYANFCVSAILTATEHSARRLKANITSTLSKKATRFDKDELEYIFIILRGIFVHAVGPFYADPVLQKLASEDGVDYPAVLRQVNELEGGDRARWISWQTTVRSKLHRR